MESFYFCETHLSHIKLFAGNQSAISPFLGGYKIGTTNDDHHHQTESQSEGTRTLAPKTVENGDNYSTAPKRNMKRSDRGNLVQ